MSFVLARHHFAISWKGFSSSFATRFAQPTTDPCGFTTSGLIHVTASHFWTATYSTVASAADMETVDTSSRLTELRKLMRERNIDIYGW